MYFNNFYIRMSANGKRALKDKGGRPIKFHPMGRMKNLTAPTPKGIRFFENFSETLFCARRANFVWKKYGSACRIR